MNKQQKLNQKRSQKPGTGDCWYMSSYHPVCVVVEVTECQVVICSTRMEFPDGMWTWGVHDTKELSRDKFKDYTGCNSGLNVRPAFCKWAARDYKKFLKAMSVC